MERYAIVLLTLIILSGCVAQEPSSEYVRPAIDASVEVGVVNDTNKETGVIFTISDYEKMARTSLGIGKTIELPTTPAAVITLESTEAGYAVFRVNNVTQSIAEESSHSFERGALRLYVARII